MVKTILNILYTIHSPRFKPWAMGIHKISQNRFNGLWICINMSHSFVNIWAINMKNILYTIHSPRFKPWAMGMYKISENRFNGLWKCINMSHSFVNIWART